MVDQGAVFGFPQVAFTKASGKTDCESQEIVLTAEANCCQVTLVRAVLTNQCLD